MPRFTEESVQRLRDAVDIVDLISRYVPLKKSGVTYKACCPFHDEKTPSFVVQKASRHYHCFGCGAHGDAVAFLMNYERLSFPQALEFLAERFHVQLDAEYEDKQAGISRGRLKRASEAAMLFFHTMLLFSDLAQGAREYLQKRGFSLQFVEGFRIGYAPENGLREYLHAEGFSDKEIEEAGLLSVRDGRKREFFSDRITFPILDATGCPIGFSARKYKEETYGGKYINTSETLLFKKSKVLFGIFYAKKRMAKERVACVVEGQLDALRLIEAGFDFTVATLGTAFGSSHVDQLRAIGVEEVYLAFDQDEAGQASAEKSGDLLMKHGVDVRVVSYRGAKDPDELLCSFGKTAFFHALTTSKSYLEFLVERAKKSSDWSSPVEKHRAVLAISQRVGDWDSALLRHESLKKVAELAGVPESALEVGKAPSVVVEKRVPEKPLQKNETFSVELDLLKLLTSVEKERAELVLLCDTNITPEDFSSDILKKLYTLSMEKLRVGEGVDFLQFASACEADAVADVLALLIAKRSPPGKVLVAAAEAVTRIKARSLLAQRELIQQKMQEPGKSDEELLALAKQYDAIGSTLGSGLKS